MEEFFPEWNWNTVLNYGGNGLGLGAVDNVGEQFDVELDDILKEYEDLSGQGQSEDERGQRQGTSKDRDSAGPPPKKKRRVKEEQVDPTKEMVGGLSSLVQELGDELEIILFYYRKSYIKNLANSNYLRLAPNVSYAEVVTELRNKIAPPYIKAPTDSGLLSVPWSNCGQDKLPFTHEKTREWKPTDLNKLQLCVFYSYYHIQLFKSDTRFYRMMSKMGFTEGEIGSLSNMRRRMDEELWNVLKSERYNETTRPEKYTTVMYRHQNTELRLIEEMKKQHDHDKRPLRPYVLMSGKNQVLMDLKDLIAWKQHESRILYNKRLKQEGPIVLDDVDWLMVEREMTNISSRIEPAEDLRRIYTFCKSDKYDHGPMSGRELRRLKTLISARRDPRIGINWIKIAEELGTHRSPVRAFQTYRNFIHTPDPLPFIHNNENRLSAFMIMRKSLGNAARTVYRLTEKFGPVSFEQFGKSWQDLNPKYAIGDLSNPEGAALVLAMEVYREELSSGKPFSVLQPRLPWRSAVDWRRKAGRLFRSYDIWTFEEDQLVLYAVDRFGLEWPGLHKVLWNRSKQTVQARYALLQKKLQHVTLSQYHYIYFRRLGKSQVGLFRSILEILESMSNDSNLNAGHPDITMEQSHEESSQSKIAKCEWEYKWTPVISERIEARATKSFSFCIDLSNSEEMLSFLEYLISNRSLSEITARELMPHRNVRTNWKTPTEAEVLAYIRAFDPKIITEARERLASYINSRENAFAKHKLDTKSQQFALQWDRRKFIPTDPVSVASALQLRNVALKLISPEVWDTLSDFEKSVCKAYQALCGVGYRTKRTNWRGYIPTKKALHFLPSVRNLLLHPKELEFEPIPSVLAICPTPEIGTEVLLGPPVSVPEIVLPDDPTNQTPSKSNVERVLPTPEHVEAYHSLCRHAWNTNNAIKVKKLTQKKRRRHLNQAAANARWEKEREQKTQGDTCKIKPRDLWFECLLRHFGQDYRGFDRTKAEEMNWEERMKGPLELLNVMHDHSYSKGYVTSVQRIVEDVKSVLFHDDQPNPTEPFSTPSTSKEIDKPNIPDPIDELSPKDKENRNTSMTPSPSIRTSGRIRRSLIK